VVVIAACHGCVQMYTGLNVVQCNDW
jgi:hypothetical protein